MRATKAQLGGLVASVALALAGVTGAYIVDRRDIAACDVLPRAEVKRIAGVQDPPEPFEPEKTGVQSTGCTYGRGEPGIYVTVFAINHGGSDLMRRGRTLGEAHGAVFTSFTGPGYAGYASGGPREGSESAVVVKHDHYVDVLVYNAPPGTAERLAIVAAGRLR